MIARREPVPGLTRDPDLARGPGSGPGRVFRASSCLPDSRRRMSATGEAPGQARGGYSRSEAA